MQIPSDDERIERARWVRGLLDDWGLPAADQVRVLGLPPTTRLRTLRKYGETLPLPDDRQVSERVEHLLAIAEALRTMHPSNSRMAAHWMNRPNRHFDSRTPVSVMVSGGLSGLIAVRANLDCTYAWDLTGSRA